MKKLFAVLFSIMVIALMGLTSAPTKAVGANLIANPSLEDSVSAKPTAWQSDKWGTNATTFTYLDTGHTGAHSVSTKMTSRSSGDAKWYFTPVTVTPNTSYTFSEWYKSNVKSSVDVVITGTNNTTTYLWKADPASTANVWKQATYTFTTPATASKVTVYHSIQAVGELTLDDYNLATTASPTPTAPTASVTAPTAGSTVRGTTSISANASDAVSVASVQFKVDGNNVGSPDTTAPYSVNWDTTSSTDAAHSVTAVATNTSGMTTTSSPVSVTVNNTVATTTPTVAISAPVSNSTVNATTTVSADASDTTPLAGVQFKIDGANLGTEDTTAPYSLDWDTKSIANGTHSLTAFARNTAGGTATSGAVSVTVNNPTPPSVSLTAPAPNATVTGLANLSANAADAKAVTSVQFKVDGTNVGSPVTASPYTFSWDSKTVTDGKHSITAVATNSDNLSTTSTAVSITVSNPTPPTVSVTAPANNATVSGTTTLTANASDAKAVSSVQFKVNGASVGTADTTAPYSFDWNTTALTNGTYTITAVATNSSNLSTTSGSVTVTVNNTVTPPPVSGANLIANPSFETANGTVPANWFSDKWGTNTSTFTYQTSGHTGSRSVKVQTTAYTNGAAEWYYNEVPVSAGKTYQYSNWYQSNVDTEVDAEVTMSDGTVQYYWLGNVPANTTWTEFKATFVTPAGAQSLAIYQILGKVGYIVSDDYSLTQNTPQALNRALVSLTFDDGWRSIYTNGFPLLQKYGLVSTQYLNSQPVVDGYPDYMTYQMIKDWAAAGHELAWHTRTHADLTTLSASALDTELTIPAAFLTGTGQPASAFTNFATPFGAYNTTSVNAIMSKYRSHRSTDVGYNTKDSFNITNIKVQNITNTTTPADVQAWVNQAIADKSWLVIVYHEVDASAADPTYAVTPANLDAELNLIKLSGITVETVQQALNEIQPQL